MKGECTYEWQRDINLLQDRFSLSLLANARAAAIRSGRTRKKNTSRPSLSEVSLSDGDKTMEKKKSITQCYHHLTHCSSEYLVGLVLQLFSIFHRRKN